MLFMIGVEVALTLFGHRNLFLDDALTRSPLVELDSNGLRQCRRERIATLITQDYLLILLVLGIILGLANRHIHRNHNEVCTFFFFRPFFYSNAFSFPKGTWFAPGVERFNSHRSHMGHYEFPRSSWPRTSNDLFRLHRSGHFDVTLDFHS